MSTTTPHNDSIDGKKELIQRNVVFTRAERGEKTEFILKKKGEIIKKSSKTELWAIKR